MGSGGTRINIPIREQPLPGGDASQESGTYIPHHLPWKVTYKGKPRQRHVLVHGCSCMKLATGAGCPPWKTLGDWEGSGSHSPERGLKGKEAQQKTCKVSGSAGQAPSAPDKHRCLASCCPMEEMKISASPSHGQPFPSRKPQILKFCRDGAKSRKTPAGTRVGRAAGSLPSERDLLQAVPGLGEGRETSCHHPNTLGGGVAPLPDSGGHSWLGWWPPVIITVSVLH